LNRAAAAELFRNGDEDLDVQHYEKLDISIVPSESGCTYPKPFDEPCIAQYCQQLARFAGLTQFT
jgi:hypothetical protein